MTSALLISVSCLRASVDLENRSCSGNDCAAGYVCNPLTTECAPPVSLDPNDVNDGDSCEFLGSFVPCASGTSGCESGCRICTTEATWSACSCTGLNCACFPSNGGQEVCDGFDNDCDGQVDGEGTSGCIQSWVDADDDGFGVGDPICICGLPEGRALLPGDPDDADPTVNPDEGEVCDGVDNNGDGNIARESDDDGDGYVECAPWLGNVLGVLGGGDCNDSDATIHPGAAEVCDGIENACLGLPDEETDEDGDGFIVCPPVAGSVPGILGGGDCDPSRPDVFPGAPEVFDDADNDCDEKNNECLIDCDCGDALVSCYRLDTLPTAIDEGKASVNGDIEVGTGALAPAIVDMGYSMRTSYYVEGESSAAHDLRQFALSVWVNPESEPTSAAARRFIVDVQSQYGLWHKKGNELSCFFASSDGGFHSVTASGALPIGRFAHVGCTYDGSVLRLYLEGRLAASQAVSAEVDTSESNKLRIGSRSTGGDAFLGVLDHLKIFDIALSNRRMCSEARQIDCKSL